MSINFSVRFENIINITNAFIAGGKQADEAKAEAKFMEEQIMQNTQKAEEYQQLCNELLVTLAPPEERKKSVSQNPTELEEVFNHEGPTIGNYSSATFHQEGQMSTIFKAKATLASSSLAVVALKVTRPSQMQPPHDSTREARILAEGRHEHVVPLMESFWFHGDRFVLVFPFLRQDLENILRTDSLTTRQAQMVLQGLFTALKHLHSLNIIHRDVKPSNILLRSMDGPVFLADFGIAWSAVDPDSEPSNAKITDVGTTCYRAPELLFGDKEYDASLDMWAAGCVVSEMVRKDHAQLFEAGPLGTELGLIKSMFTTLGTPTEKTWPSVCDLPDWNKVRFQDFPAKPWTEILPGASSCAIDFVKRTVCYEKSVRLTASEALDHELISKVALPQ